MSLNPIADDEDYTSLGTDANNSCLQIKVVIAPNVASSSLCDVYQSMQDAGAQAAGDWTVITTSVDNVSNNAGNAVV